MPAQGTSEAPPGTRPISVVLVSSTALVRVALRQLLSQAEGMQVVGEAGTAGEAVAVAGRVYPDVVVVDAADETFGANGVLERIKVICPDARPIILSDEASGDRVFDAAQAGVWGYLPRDITQGELIRSVQAVAGGKVALGYVISPQEFVRLGTFSRRSGPPTMPLSPRESRVLKAMAEGHTDEEIARQLGLSVPTVKTYVRSILRKTSARNRTAAIAAGFRSGLLP